MGDTDADRKYKRTAMSAHASETAISFLLVYLCCKAYKAITISNSIQLVEQHYDNVGLVGACLVQYNTV